MIEFPDDELDKLFRKTSEELESEYDPDDWGILSRRLDAHDDLGAGLPWYHRLPLVSILGLLILSTILLFTRLTMDREHTGRSKEDSSGLKLVESDRRLASPASYESSSGSIKISESSVPKLENRIERFQPLVKGSLLPHSVNNALTQPRSEGSKSYAAPVKKKISLIANKRGLFSRNQKNTLHEERYSHVPNRENSGTVNEVPVASDDSLGLERGAYPEVKGLSIKGFTGVGTTVSWPKIAVPEGMILERAQFENLDRDPRWAIKIGLSPDLGSVRFMHEARIGRSVALLGEYAIVPKLYLQTGVVMSTKKYMAEHGDYTWPDNWAQAVMPKAVDGTCKIIELPVNVRYDILSRPGYRWSASLGASSYYMGNEKYLYRYAQDDPSIKWYGWEGETGWYWLSHMTASVGYEYRVSQLLSVMVEPTVTVPLRKVGFGKVNLFTTGLWFSVRYTPRFR